MNLESIFLDNIPLIDVRAPVEFAAGHFPTSINLPILSDEERRLVGLTYKKEGQKAAIALGHQLVSGSVKQNRVQAWLDFLKTHPTAKLHCFRGGLRSQIARLWIEEAGERVDLVPGGFKALRHCLLAQLESPREVTKLLLLAGKTGAGKTEFLYRQPLPFVDLEKEANHRGSSFGFLGVQPSQVTFENRLAIHLLKHRKTRVLLFEDEPITIGRCAFPKPFFERMRTEKIVLLERSFSQRTTHIVEEYVLERIRREGGEVRATLTDLELCLGRISKKLGGQRHQEIVEKLRTAFGSREVVFEEPHRDWVQTLLKYYYDPLYELGIQSRQDRIAFRGEEEECRGYLASQLTS